MSSKTWIKGMKRRARNAGHGRLQDAGVVLALLEDLKQPKRMKVSRRRRS